MQAGPDLIAAAIEARLVRDVADVVVGQLENVGVAERRAALDLLAQHREELAGDAHDRHVADQDGLDPGLARPALAGAASSRRIARKVSITVWAAAGSLIRFVQ